MPGRRQIDFQTKPAIALDQIRQAVADGVPPGVVLADAGYGADMKFQAGLLDLALSYVPVCRSEASKIRHDKPDLRRDAAAGGDVLGVQPNSSVWPDGEGPLPAKAWSGQGRPPTRLQHSDDHQPVSAKDLALSLPMAS